MNNIFDPENYKGLTSIEKARATFFAMRQYQQDWIEYGVDSVHLYFDDVEGDWLEEWDASDVVSITKDDYKATVVATFDHK